MRKTEFPGKVRVELNWGLSHSTSHGRNIRMLFGKMDGFSIIGENLQKYRGFSAGPNCAKGLQGR